MLSNGPRVANKQDNLVPDDITRPVRNDLGEVMNKLTTVEQIASRFGLKWFTFVNSANNVTSRTFRDSDAVHSTITCFRLADNGRQFDQVELFLKGRFDTSEATIPTIKEMWVSDVRVDQPAYKFLGSYEELEPVLAQFLSTEFAFRCMDDAVATVKSVTRHRFELNPELAK